MPEARIGTRTPAGSAPGATLAVISRRIVALIKEHYGKGPTNTRTYHLGDLVVVLMRGGFTQVERTLIDDGRGEAVEVQRAAFQEVMRPQFKRVIEEELHREVAAFMSATHHDPDLNAEIFVLAAKDPWDAEREDPIPPGEMRGDPRGDAPAPGALDSPAQISPRV